MTHVCDPYWLFIAALPQTKIVYSTAVLNDSYGFSSDKKPLFYLRWNINKLVRIVLPLWGPAMVFHTSLEMNGRIVYLNCQMAVDGSVWRYVTCLRATPSTGVAQNTMWIFVACLRLIRLILKFIIISVN